MIEVCEINLASGKERIEIQGFEPILFQIKASKDLLLSSIKVLAFNRELKLDNFCENFSKPLRVESGNCAHFTCIIGDRKKPIILLVGLFSIVFIDLIRKDIKELYKIYYRNNDDDFGFYKTIVNVWDEGFIIRLEYEVRNYDFLGNLIWAQDIDYWDSVELTNNSVTIISENGNKKTLQLRGNK